MSDANDPDPKMTRRETLAAGAALTPLALFGDGPVGILDTHEVLDEQGGEVVENFGVDPEVMSFAEGLKVERRDDGGVAISWDADAAGQPSDELEEWIEDDSGALRGPELRTEQADIGAASIELTNNRSVNVAQYSGATLAQKLENAVAEYGPSYRYEIPGQNPEGGNWTWDKAVSIPQGSIEIVAPYQTNIDYTVTAGNGAILELTGDDVLVQGLQFRQTNSENPDYGFRINGASEVVFNHLFVDYADVGFRVDSQAFKNHLQHCRTNHTQSTGISIDTAPNYSLQDCYVSNSGGYGFDIGSSNATGLYNCSADNSAGKGLGISAGTSGFGVYNFTLESAETSSGNAMIYIAGQGTDGVISGGFSIDGSSTRDGIRFDGGGPYSIKNFNIGCDGTAIKTNPLGSSGEYGQEYPIINLDTDRTDHTVNERALIYSGGGPIFPTNVVASGEPGIRHEGEQRYHDGTDGSNTNAEGPAVAINGSWVSLVDGGTIA